MYCVCNCVVKIELEDMLSAGRALPGAGEFESAVGGAAIAAPLKLSKNELPSPRTARSPAPPTPFLHLHASIMAGRRLRRSPERDPAAAGGGQQGIHLVLIIIACCVGGETDEGRQRPHQRSAQRHRDRAVRVFCVVREH